MKDYEDLLTVKEIVEYCRVNKFTVYNWIKKEGLPIVRLGRIIRIRRTDFDEWIKKQNPKDNAERSE
jgi:excisionase family DNA binding protein